MRFFPDRIDVPEDPILGLVSQFGAELRSEKCDLGIGVYKDAGGRTPVLSCVKEAEERLLRVQETKAYMGLQGNLEYINAVRDLVFGPDDTSERLASAQVPGGSFALSLASMMISKIAPQATIWSSAPGWSSYAPLLVRDQLGTLHYTYTTTNDGELDIAAMLRSLDPAQPGDVVVLQANCHNPTGIDPTPHDWEQISGFLRARELVPLVDVAYQGFSNDPESDADAVRWIVTDNHEGFVATTNSKNFGLYRERTGCLFVRTRDTGTAGMLQGLMNDILRRYHAMPPDHGAAVVALILNDAQLRTQWLAELGTMRLRLEMSRARLANMASVAGDPTLANAVRRGRGMFTRLPLEATAIARLRAEYAIYLTGDGRINLGGLMDESFDRIARLLIAAATHSGAKKGSS